MCIRDSALSDKDVHYIAGETDKESREMTRQFAEKNNVIIIASLGVFSTGVNIPALHNVIFSSPTKSKIRVLQSVGRILRKHDSKETATVYDIADKIYKNKGHWMDNLEASALDWMSDFIRNPYPSKVVWKQGNVLHKRFYWLRNEDPSVGDLVECIIDDQIFTILSSSSSKITIQLNDDLVDMDKETHNFDIEDLKSKFEIGSEDINDVTFVGQRIQWKGKPGSPGSYIEVDQKVAIDELREVNFEKHLADNVLCSPALHTEYRSVLGMVNWLQSRTQYHSCYKFSRCASMQAHNWGCQSLKQAS